MSTEGESSEIEHLRCELEVCKHQLGKLQEERELLLREVIRDMGNPVENIRHFIDCVQDGTWDFTKSEKMKNIDSCIGLLSQRLNSLATLNWLNDHELKQEEFSTSQVFGEVIAKLKLAKRKTTILFDSDSYDLICTGDRKCCSHIIECLVEMGFAYCEKGDIILRTEQCEGGYQIGVSFQAGLLLSEKSHEELYHSLPLVTIEAINLIHIADILHANLEFNHGGQEKLTSVTLMVPDQQVKPVVPDEIQFSETTAMVLIEDATRKMLLERQVEYLGFTCLTYDSLEMAFLQLSTAPPSFIIAGPHVCESENEELQAILSENSTFLILLDDGSKKENVTIECDRVMRMPITSFALQREIKAVLGEIDESSWDLDSATDDSRSSTLHIMLVEDSKSDAQLLRKMIEKFGFESTHVQSGEEALTVFQEGKFDVIFMDLEMPGLSGLDTSNALRLQGATVPIVALTSNTEDHYRNACFKAGMNQFVEKPYNAESIYNVIQHVSGIKKDETKGTRLLIVEDDEALLKLLSLHFWKIGGLEVEVARDGVEACAKLGRFCPDIILTDLMMPKMRGEDLIHYVRNDRRHKNTAIIVHSAKEVSSPEVRNLEQYNIEAYMRKPCKLADLDSAVRVLMDLN